MLIATPTTQGGQFIRDKIGQYQSENEREVRLREAAKIEEILASDSDNFSPDAYKTVTISEFSNGLLLCETLYPQHKTLAIEMMQQLQEEYGCESISAQATCEITTIAFVRVLELKQLMKESLAFQQDLAAGHSCGHYNVFAQSINKHEYFGCNACNRARIEIEKYGLLGKQLDQANRAYFSAIQTLRMMKQAPLQVTVKANTAIIGQNQMVQANNHG